MTDFNELIFFRCEILIKHGERFKHGTTTGTAKTLLYEEMNV
jgi:hypothetical protein